jgi:hypothetical protein
MRLEYETLKQAESRLTKAEQTKWSARVEYKAAWRAANRARGIVIALERKGKP